MSWKFNLKCRRDFYINRKILHCLRNSRCILAFIQDYVLLRVMEVESHSDNRKCNKV